MCCLNSRNSLSKTRKLSSGYLVPKSTFQPTVSQLQLSPCCTVLLSDGNYIQVYNEYIKSYIQNVHLNVLSETIVFDIRAFIIDRHCQSSRNCTKVTPCGVTKWLRYGLYVSHPFTVTKWLRYDLYVSHSVYCNQMAPLRFVRKSLRVV
jgi:hypothetical protein